MQTGTDESYVQAPLKTEEIIIYSSSIHSIHSSDTCEVCTQLCAVMFVSKAVLSACLMHGNMQHQRAFLPPDGDFDWIARYYFHNKYIL